MEEACSYPNLGYSVIMTRTQQTWAIIMAIAVAVVALITAYFVIENKKEYDKRYPGCWQLIGENTKCKSDHAVRRLTRGY